MDASFDLNLEGSLKTADYFQYWPGIQQLIAQGNEPLLRAK
jgi:hypothetical protein